MQKFEIIGKDIVDQSNFGFGAFRYIVERSNEDTTIYKFDDHWQEVWIGKSNQILSDVDIKQMILDCNIDFIQGNSEEFEKYFMSDEDAKCYFFFERTLGKKKHVNHGYKECKFPYEKCPHCGADIEEMVMEPENAVDCFNSRYGGFNGDYESYSWEEIYECPECGKRFYIVGEN